MLLLALAAPANGAIELQGLHAYPDRESVPAGETIRFHVSSRVPYRFGVSKLGLRVDDRASDETIFWWARYRLRACSLFIRGLLCA